MNSTMRLILIAIVMLVVASLVGCKDKGEKVSLEEYNKMKENTTLECGVTIDELESILVKFAHNVYNPQNDTDIAKGIDRLKDIVTELEYQELLRLANQYNPDNDANITDVIVWYSTKENNSDGMDRVYLEIVMSNTGISRRTIIEFVFNPNNKIARHYIWTGELSNH